MPATTGGITGGSQREQTVIGDAGNVQGEAFLGLRRELHAKGDSQGREPSVD
jgi:hypothetical protein